MSHDVEPVILSQELSAVIAGQTIRIPCEVTAPAGSHVNILWKYLYTDSRYNEELTNKLEDDGEFIFTFF